MRRRARECALQILYQLDMTREGGDLDTAIAGYWSSFEAVREEERAFAERLARGVVAERDAIDKAISVAASNWKVTRMDKVDRNLLRVAAFEILYCADIPRAASINEAVEIAKRYSGTESSAFINGVLDHIGTEEA